MQPRCQRYRGSSQYPELLVVWEAATLMTTMSGPGVSGMWSSVKSRGPRLPPLFSHTSILPEPGLKTFTQSLKSANLKLVLRTKSP